MKTYLQEFCYIKKSNLLLFGIYTTAIFFYYFSPEIVEKIGSYLPANFTKRSRGHVHFSFFHPIFGFENQLRFNSLLIIVATSIAQLFRLSKFSNIKSKALSIYKRFSGRHLSIFVFCFSSIFLFTHAYYLAFPLDYYASNAIFHWVEMPILNTPGWHYYFPNQIRRPFMEYPEFFVAANHVLNFYLIFAIMNRYCSSMYSFCSAIIYSFSAPVLDFVGLTEDVSLCVLSLLLVTLAISRKKCFWIGIAIFFAFLFRFQFLSLFIAYLLAELWNRINKQDNLGPQLTRVISQFISFASLGLIYSLVCIRLGGVDIISGFLNHKKHASRLAQNSLPSFNFQDLDYFGHLTWMFPWTIVIAPIITLIFIRKFSPKIQFLMIFMLASSFGNILFLEMVATWRFNYRYLAYVFPFLYLILALAISQRKIIEKRHLNCVLVASLLLTTLGTKTKVYRSQEYRSNKMLSPFLHNKETLRSWDISNIITNLCEPTGVNFITGLFLTRKSKVRCIKEGDDGAKIISGYRNDLSIFRSDNFDFGVNDVFVWMGDKIEIPGNPIFKNKKIVIYKVNQPFSLKELYEK